MSWATAAKTLRKAKSWTLAEAAGASNGELNIGTLGNIERGRHENPTDSLQQRLARLYGITVEQLRREAGLGESPSPSLEQLRAEAESQGASSALLELLQDMEREQHTLGEEGWRTMTAVFRGLVAKERTQPQKQRVKRTQSPAPQDSETERDEPPIKDRASARGLRRGAQV